MALGFGGYFRHFVDIPARVVAVVVLVVTGGIASLGVQRAVRLTVALSVVQVAGLVAVIVVGVPHLGEHSIIGPTSATGVLAGAGLVFFAVIGFDEVVTLAEETRDPNRTVLRARLIALAVAAMIATVNTTLLVITAASRLTWSMASTGSLPEQLRVLNRHRVPGRALADRGLLWPSARTGWVGGTPRLTLEQSLDVLSLIGILPIIDRHRRGMKACSTHDGRQSRRAKRSQGRGDRRCRLEARSGTRHRRNFAVRTCP